jgi:phosphohistidine phosphatase SixA
MRLNPSPRPVRALALLLSGFLGLLGALAAGAAQPAPPAAPQAQPPAAPPLEGKALVTALRGGGYVIFFRHGATDMSQKDTDFDHLEACATQRNLSAAGREQAAALGRDVLALGLPIDRVLASPFCRTRDTARLAFGRSQAVADLSYRPTADPAANKKLVAAGLARLLAEPPAAGKDTVIVAHNDNVAAAAGLQLAEGEAAVFKPLGKDGFQLVARVRPDEWRGLGAS